MKSSDLTDREIDLALPAWAEAAGQAAAAPIFARS
jgi:hypothetical protein